MWTVEGLEFNWIDLLEILPLSMLYFIITSSCEMENEFKNFAADDVNFRIYVR